GWSVIRRALLAVTQIGEQRLRELSRLHADAGKTAFEALLDQTSPEPFTLAESAATFEALQAARGPLAKGDLLQQRLARLTPLEGSYLVRILTGDLRIGLKEGLVEEAIAAAFGATADEVREANMLFGDIGETAVAAAQKRLGEITLRLFRPIKCMLASPEPTAAAVWMRLMQGAKENSGEENRSLHTEDPARTAALPRAGFSPEAQRLSSAFWAEDKYDGIRAQLHVAEGRAEIFSRDLRLVTRQFPEVARAAREFAGSAIFDGEILAFEEGRRLTFFDLQKRLGRKTEDDLFLSASDVPVVFKAFDLLFLHGSSLLKEPLFLRRNRLENLQLPSGLEVGATIPISSADEIESAFQAARLRGNEGLMIKAGASIYTPGRRGLAWLKLKKELTTLDVVVTGVQTGNGKRSHVLSDYTFAIRDDASGALLTIGKAFSGLTDVEIEELTEHFTATTLAQHGSYREVKPQIVLEIAFDSIQPSTRHASGLAMRFPRIKAIRRDKTPAEIDTLSFARSLVGNVTAAPRPPRRE
ncbi:MAG TPA: ATP-dependent DNA ligase, partial [Chthoniobacteraceae bacterium]